MTVLLIPGTRFLRATDAGKESSEEEAPDTENNDDNDDMNALQ